MRLLSVENDTENRLRGQRSWDFDVKRIGYRYHMSNINAAIGRVQLNTIDNTSGGLPYSDFTSISTVLTKGSQYTLTVTPVWSGRAFRALSLAASLLSKGVMINKKSSRQFRN